MGVKQMENVCILLNNKNEIHMDEEKICQVIKAFFILELIYDSQFHFIHKKLIMIFVL